MSRMQTSGLGTIGAAFLYLDALKRHAILIYSRDSIVLTKSMQRFNFKYQFERELCHPTAIKPISETRERKMKENENKN